MTMYLQTNKQTAYTQVSVGTVFISLVANCNP